jgi:O-antigen/teichoic acid export membrane protein
MAIRRIGLGVIAQGYSQGVSILLQLVTTPMLIAIWGASQYGLWLIVSTLPAYLVLLDLGFSQTAANDMSVKMAHDERTAARRTYESLVGLFLCVVIPALVFCAMVVCLVPLDWLGSDQAASMQSHRTAVILLIGYVAAALLSGVVSAALRAEGLFSTMIALNTTSRLLEGFGIVVVARFLGAGIEGAAAAMLAVRLLATAVMIATLHAKSDLLRLRIAHAEISEARRLLWPSVMYLGFPLGNALSIQGALLAVGFFLSPATVAAFATSRTLARLGVSILAAINQVFLFEYAVRMRNSRRLLRLGYLHLAVECIGLVFFFGILLVFGARIYEIWLGGRVPFDQAVFLTVVCQSALESVWAACITPLIAWNKHAGVAASYVGGTAVAVLGVAGILSAGGSLAQSMTVLAAMYGLLAIDAVIRLRRVLRPMFDARLSTEVGQVP